MNGRIEKNNTKLSMDGKKEEVGKVRKMIDEKEEEVKKLAQLETQKHQNIETKKSDKLLKFKEKEILDGRQFKIQTSINIKNKGGEKEKFNDLKKLEKEGKRARKGTGIRRIIGDLERIGDGKTASFSEEEESESEEMGDRIKMD